MSLKIISILTAFIATITTILYFVRDQQQTNSDTVVMAEQTPIIEVDKMEQLKRFSIAKRDGNSVTIEKMDNGLWIIPSYYNAPVQYTKLTDFTARLTSNKINRFITDNPNTMERLNLGEESIFLEFEDTSNVTIEIGNTGKSGGVYFKYSNKPQAWLSEAPVQLDIKNFSWAIDQPLAYLSTNTIQSITMELNDDPEFTIYRNAREEPFTIDRIPTGMVLNVEKIEDMIGAITQLRISSITELSTDPIVKNIDKNTLKIKLKTFIDQKVYHILIAQEILADTQNTKNDKPILVNIKYPESDHIWNQVQEKGQLKTDASTLNRFVELYAKLFIDQPEESEDQPDPNTAE